MAAHGARRLLPMAENAAHIVGIEVLEEAQCLDFRAPLPTSAALERARRLLRQTVPHLDEDRLLAPDLAFAAQLVRKGALAGAMGADLLPSALGESA
jgi:histidine ammonia-lyase